MAMEKKIFRKCVLLSPCFMTPEDMHRLCVIRLGAEHVHSVLEEAECDHSEKFSVKKLHSCLSLFLREEEHLQPAVRALRLPASFMGVIG